MDVARFYYHNNVQQCRNNIVYDGDKELCLKKINLNWIVLTERDPCVDNDKCNMLDWRWKVNITVFFCHCCLDKAFQDDFTSCTGAINHFQFAELILNAQTPNMMWGFFSCSADHGQRFLQWAFIIISCTDKFRHIKSVADCHDRVRVASRIIAVQLNT